MQKITTVLFDFDGTLMDTNNIIIESWQHMFKAMNERERSVAEITKTLGEPLTFTMEKLFPNIDISKPLEIYRDFHRDTFVAKVELFDGMKELVIALKEKGYKLGIVTSRKSWSTTRGLEKFGLDKYFDVVITADDTEKHKPDPGPANIALTKLGSTADESIMIGDTKFDVLCAKNAGLKSVLVDWSVALPKEERIGENAPDYVIYKANELLEILQAEY
jgi:pyrophosphatase PpaX